MSEGESNQFDLGERVDVTGMPSQPTPGLLPHPQGDHDPWGSAESTSQAFAGKPQPGPQQRQAGLPVGYNPAAPQQSAPPPQAPAPAASRLPDPVKRPVPETARATRKETAVLKKFRETFSLKRIDIERGVLVRRHPTDPSKNAEMEFGLRGLGYEDYQWVVEKAITLQQNPRLFEFAWKIALASMATAEMGGIPLWEALGFEPSDPEHVRDPLYPHMGLRFQTAEAWCEELSTSLFDTVEDLYKLYDDLIDKQYTAKPVKKEEEEVSPPFDQTASGS